ncbi:hypothetical protein GcC1_181023 [Golovinomyces cichoracearum]|uniref:Uncharacterized protein n=1 Tax=Golovinomyces cichoracearum TaxID=62708 RepID=A0A420HMG0_9PEZI|nr:hypothetical protein GcC1_181023 [Golovinomyces cichoracearum]
MGADKKVSLLPAPTESESLTGGTEFESRITDKTSYSLPEDGSPITIATRRRRSGKDGYGLKSNKSQTSLLIEYFEGGKNGHSESRRPSVRVKVRPSLKNRSRSSNDHIQISERKATRKTSHTKQIKIHSNYRTENRSEFDEEIHSIRSYGSTTEDSNLTSKGSGQIEVEITPRRHGSPLIPTIETGPRIHHKISDISSVPENSFLDGKTSSLDFKQNRSFTTDNVISNSDRLGMPVRSRSRSLSREKVVVQKAVEKVRNEHSEQRRRKTSSRSQSVCSDALSESIKQVKRSSQPHKSETMVSGADSSFLKSHLSAKTGEAYSFRSATSKSSLNNPKLLETVEDAIRRLILPELSALKREQSKHIHHENRVSPHSRSDLSRDSKDNNLNWKNSHHAIDVDLAMKPEARTNETDIISGVSSRDLIDNKHIGYTEDSSATIFERETSIETINQENLQLLSRDNNMKERTMTKADVLEVDLIPKNSNESFDRARQERKKQRSKSSSRSHSRSQSRGKSVVETHQQNFEPISPMLLINETDPSEITRSSILSAQSEKPDTAMRDLTTPLREVPRGIASPISRTPNRTPVMLQYGLGTQHSNHSRGDVSLHSQQCEPHLRSIAEHESNDVQKTVNKSPHLVNSAREGFHHEEITTTRSSFRTFGDETTSNIPIDTYNRNQDKSHYFYQDIQEVPPPLNYIPYAHERRGLSPIPSVSGWTEGEPENQQGSRLVRSISSYASIGHHATQRLSCNSMKSNDSNGSQENPYDFPDVRQGGLADSEISQDHEYWAEQHRENNRNRRIDKRSYRLLDSRTEYQETINYTSDSVKNRNPNEPYNSVSKKNSQLDIRMAENEPDMMSIDNDSDLNDGTNISSQIDKGLPATSIVGSQSTPNLKQKYQTDEIQIPEMSESQEAIATEEALTTAAATAVLENRKRTFAVDSGRYEDKTLETSGSYEKISFSERVKEISDLINIPSIGPSDEESIGAKKIEMSASGIPDVNDPMPEIGFGHRDSDDLTNSSIIGSPIEETHHQTEDHLSDRSPDLQKFSRLASIQSPTPTSDKEAKGTKLEEPEKNKDREPNDVEDWGRDTTERKRDTLVTNPYENTSPVGAADVLDREISEYHGLSPSRLPYQDQGTRSKNERYISPEPDHSLGGSLTPEQKPRNIGDAPELNRDPFYSPRQPRNLSGMSHGMSSPLYDSSTGNGIDRIESRDIVALMDHLTVRDAQRSARDTEILVTLVRAAAEMRNSFEDMKRLLADTEDVIITEVQMNTDQSVQKVINGPRPPPQSGRRPYRQSSYHDMYEDIPTKKRNVFRRALKGLSMKSANDLGKIEEMLVQLLGEVEGLKIAQGLRPMSQKAESNERVNQSTNYNDNNCNDPDSSTSFSTRDHDSSSVHTSIEKVELRDADTDTKANTGHQKENEYPSTPARKNSQGNNINASSPPPQNSSNSPVHQIPFSAGTDKGKKHKTAGSSGWIPKVSRWSEVKTSTVFRGFKSAGRISGRKGNEPANSSNSGNNVCQFSEKYSSNTIKFHSEYPQDLENGKSDLPASHLYPDDPKYRVHRDSMNLQHPQPRQGPTDRYQTTLESRADSFESRTPPNEIDREAEKPSNNAAELSKDRHISNRSPVSDGGFSASNQPSPKPSQENFGYDRSMKSHSKPVKPSPLSNENLVEDENGRSSSPRNLRGLHGIPTRKPTGPRTMSHAQSNSYHQNE